MAFDADAYIDLLDDLPMPRERKIALMEQVALILQSFVDRAFGIAPEQTLLGTSAKKITAAGPDTIGWGLTLTPKFNDAAKEKTARKRFP